MLMFWKITGMIVMEKLFLLIVQIFPKLFNGDKETDFISFFIFTNSKQRIKKLQIEFIPITIHPSLLVLTNKTIAIKEMSRKNVLEIANNFIFSRPSKYHVGANP